MHRTVLVIEDDQDIRDSLRTSLSLFGYNTDVAANGREALELLSKQSQKPSLIFLDLMMPVMDGQEFRKRQLSDPALSKIPVVLVTADGNAKSKAELLGAQAGITKPFEVDELIRVTEKFCGK